MQLLKFMNSLMKKHIPFILISNLLALLTILSNIGLLSTSSILISRAALHPEVLDLMVLIVGVRFFGISRGFLRYLERIVSHNTTFKILSSLRKWVYKSYNEVYSENNKQAELGAIYTKLVSDIDILKELFLRVIYPLITAVLTGLITSTFIALYSKTVSVTYIIFYIFTGFVLPIILYKLNSRLIERENILRKEINALLLDLLNGTQEVFIYSIRDVLSKKYSELRKEFSELQIKKNMISALGDNIYSLSLTLLIALTLAVCAPLITEGKFSGIYFAMLPLAIMASFEALLPMPNLLYKYNECVLAARSLFSIIKPSNSNNTPGAIEISCSGLYVKDICILEPVSKEYILKDISFELPKGRKLAIVGMSGSGKSTLLKALLGFVSLSSGEIKINNMPYSNLDIDVIRSQYTYVDQHPYLFNTTIRENLIIADPMAEEKAIFQALSNTQIYNLVKELPEGLNTIIGQFGSRVSAGEKQRLAIARALLKNSPIVLLDEPTANLDVLLEERIINSIHRTIRDKSCIWVTHRLVGMDNMDEILLIDRGQIIERGTHRELIDKKGLYFKLWKTQKQYVFTDC